MAVVVQKFGGSSVKDAESVMEAARKAIRAKHAGNKVIVVVSAQGSTTDDLIAKAGEITAAPKNVTSRLAEIIGGIEQNLR